MINDLTDSEDTDYSLTSYSHYSEEYKNQRDDTWSNGMSTGKEWI